MLQARKPGVGGVAVKLAELWNRGVRLGMGELKMMMTMKGKACSRPNELRWNRKGRHSAIGCVAPE